jgi:phosphatidylserine/phosphatidylglycerophosphate/cardiolipin synthase-like enzyme
LTEEPPHLGSWKGRVLEAIAVHNIRDWNGLFDYTQLNRETLNMVLSELYNLGLISKNEDDGRYWIENSDVYRQYKSHFEKISPVTEALIGHENQSNVKLQQAMPKDDDITKWVIKWRDFKNLTFSLDARHFFLEGTYIDDLSKDLIRQARQEVLLVNPYIEQCHLSNTLIDAIVNKAKVIAITRPVHEEDKFREEKVAYHKSLENEGIQLHYDRRIHAKLLVVDQRIAVISSMNFIVTSAGGSSWEAGIISIDEAIVHSIHKTIHQLLTKFE